MAIIVWMAIYPTITVLYMFLGSYFDLITALPLRTLATTFGSSTAHGLYDHAGIAPGI